MRRRLEMRWSRRGAPGHINVGELRSRRALWRSIAGRPSDHGHRHAVVYDSAVTLGAGSRGRSTTGSPGVTRELRLTYPYILASDAEEGALWCESEANLADYGSRGRALPVPAPMRRWVHDYLHGDFEALDRRVHSPPTVETDGEAAQPGPPKARRRGADVRAAERTGVDLRVRAQGEGTRPGRLAELVADFERWLAAEGRPDLDTLARQQDDLAELDGALADYGQHMWRTGGSQHAFAETLNGVRHRHNHVRRRLGGAWSVRTAWEHMEPGENRTPIPPVLARALVVLCLIWGWPVLAALLMLGFEAALRPGDLLFLERGDLRFRGEHGDDSDALYVVLRHSKTARLRGARWQHVRVCDPAVIALMYGAFGAWPLDAQLFRYAGPPAARGRKMAAYVQALCAALQVPYGEQAGFTLGGLRAGGVTALFQRHGDLDMVRWRGRWDDQRTMEHYIQELPMARAFADLPADVRAQLRALGRLLPYFLCSMRLDRAPPP